MAHKPSDPIVNKPTNIIHYESSDPAGKSPPRQSDCRTVGEKNIKKVAGTQGFQTVKGKENNPNPDND